jgi:hypothetical protein
MFKEKRYKEQTITTTVLLNDVLIYICPCPNPCPCPWTRTRTYGHMDMDIWTFKQKYSMDIRTCCRDAGYDYTYTLFFKFLPGMLKICIIKKHGEFSGLFRCLFTFDILSH